MQQVCANPLDWLATQTTSILPALPSMLPCFRLRFPVRSDELARLLSGRRERWKNLNAHYTTPPSQADDTLSTTPPSKRTYVVIMCPQRNRFLVFGFWYFFAFYAVCATGSLAVRPTHTIRRTAEARATNPYVGVLECRLCLEMFYVITVQHCDDRQRRVR